eukprot:gene18459-5934_t
MESKLLVSRGRPCQFTCPITTGFHLSIMAHVPAGPAAPPVIGPAPAPVPAGPPVPVAPVVPAVPAAPAVPAVPVVPAGPIGPPVGPIVPAAGAHLYEARFRNLENLMLVGGPHGGGPRGTGQRGGRGRGGRGGRGGRFDHFHASQESQSRERAQDQYSSSSSVTDLTRAELLRHNAKTKAESSAVERLRMATVDAASSRMDALEKSVVDMQTSAKATEMSLVEVSSSNAALTAQAAKAKSTIKKLKSNVNYLLGEIREKANVNDVNDALSRCQGKAAPAHVNRGNNRLPMFREDSDSE